MTYRRLKHLCQDAGQYGYNWPASDYVPEGDGLRLLRTTDLKPEGLLPPSEGIFVPPPVPEEFLLRRNDILLSRSGTVGRSYLVPEEASGSTFAGFLVRFRPLQNVDARYVTYALSSLPMQERIQAEAISSTIQNFNAERYANLAIWSPDLDGQRRIADFLDDQVSRIEQAIALRELQSSVLLARRDAYVRGLLTGQTQSDLVRTNSRWFPCLPSDWATMQLKYRWQVIDCKHRTPTYQVEGYPLVSTGDITAGRLDLTKTGRFVDHSDFLDLADSLRRPIRGDIVYSRNASLGTASYVDTNEPFTMGQDVCRITSPGDQLYLCHVLNFLVGEQVEEESVGSTFKRINIDRIRRLEVPVPPAAQQEQIAQGVDHIVAESGAGIAAMNRSRRLLTERMQGLMTAAVTGQFDVTTARAVA